MDNSTDNHGNDYGPAFTAPPGYAPYVYQQPGPIYYPQTPIIQTPQTGMAPVYPIHATNSGASPTPPATTQIEVVSNDSGNANTDTSTAAATITEIN